MNKWFQIFTHEYKINVGKLKTEFVITYYALQYKQ